MNFNTRTNTIVAAASTVQSLSQSVADVTNVTVINGSSVATSYSVTSGSASASAVQFTGTPDAPSQQITFNTALTAGETVLVDVVDAGAIPAKA